MKHEELNIKKMKNIEKRNRNKYKTIVIKSQIFELAWPPPRCFHHGVALAYLGEVLGLLGDTKLQLWQVGSRQALYEQADHSKVEGAS